MSCPDRERGAALLTVLMLVAVIAVMATAALEKLRLSTRLAGNAAVIEQARGYAFAAETLALSRVTNLLTVPPARLTLASGSADRALGLPLPGGAASARIADGGNCFNLNGLVTETGPGIYASAPDQRAQLVRLLRLLAIPAPIAEQVAGGAADWIDSDQDQQTGGAEDASYLGREPGYRTAGTLMSGPSELRAVNGVTPEIYTRLRPWICTLPIAQPARINVNTLAPEQAPLLAMLLPDTVSVEAARQLLLRRPPAGYASTDAFWRAAALSDETPAAEQIGVTSTWFDLRIDVALGAASVQERALIDANRLPARLVSRQWGGDL